jgi:hypothetical protein
MEVAPFADRIGRLIAQRAGHTAPLLGWRIVNASETLARPE